MKPCIGLFFSKPVLHLAAVLLLMGGCTAFQPAIQTRTMTPGEYIAVKRGDILTRGELSTTTRETLSITGLADGSCASPSRACIEALKGGAGLSEEQRQSALAELWVAYAQTLPSSDPAAEAGTQPAVRRVDGSGPPWLRVPVLYRAQRIRTRIRRSADPGARLLQPGYARGI